MDTVAAIFAALVAGAAYYFGNRSGWNSAMKSPKAAFYTAIVNFAYDNPGISNKRIHELADSLIASDGDMREQAVAHIRKAAQEAVGLKEQA